ncbi:MAG: methyl-accepting chemotaxis protein [Treponema sp.]|jgi:methyl-accepting chemotaxis protein|nr:methyl-accepting chemotaxis protein [Treponema sp.]
MVHNQRSVFLFLIGITSVINGALNGFLLLLFRSGAVSPDQLWIRAGLPILGYMALVNLVLGRNARFFDGSSFKVSKSGGDEYVQALKNLGAVPVKAISISVVLELAVLGLLFIQGEAVGIPGEISVILFLAALSGGMFMSILVYVLSDGLVSRTLISHNLYAYPRELREQRQGLKIFVIPVAVTMLSMAFVFSLTLLGVYQSGASLSAIKPHILKFTGIFISFFLGIIVLAVMFRKNLSILFNSVIEQLENLSSAQRDLTKRVSICSVDELGTIAGMMNDFCDALGDGMREIKASQRSLSDSGKQLQNNALGMAGSISHIFTGFEQVQEKAQNQKQSTSQSSAAVQQIARNIESLDSSIANQSSNIHHASAAVAELVENVTSIGGMIEKMREHFQTLNDAASHGGIAQKENSAKVQEIVEESTSLQETNKIIATIASKTNLLAMNAAIEAAHAGEAGRGFAVVADEIRKLAEDSSRESRKIHEELKQVMETITGIAQGSQTLEQSFNQVSLRVQETEQLVLEIDRAIKEQQEGAGQILEALKQMNDSALKVKTGSEAMNQGNAVILKEMDQLQVDSKEIVNNLEAMVTRITQINEKAGHISLLAGNTESAIQHITRIVDSFEV